MDPSRRGAVVIELAITFENRADRSAGTDYARRPAMPSESANLSIRPSPSGEFELLIPYDRQIVRPCGVAESIAELSHRPTSLLDVFQRVH